MNKIIKQADLEPWTKSFQNLRSTRETELFRLTWNIKAVYTCIGNSPEVALKHYAQVIEADQREPLKMSVLDAGKRVQNTVHTGADSSCTELHEAKGVGTLETLIIATEMQKKQ